MKKLLFLIPVFLLNCTKKEVDATISTNKDSMKVEDQNTVINTDSSNNGVIAIQDSTKKTNEISSGFRVIEGDKIVKTINGDMLPLTLEDELTADHGQMIIKIKNFKGNKISGTVKSLKPGLNIRFNQIRMADGEYDGPFGSEVNYEIKNKGEIWLIIGKNLMATTETTGKFKVTLK